MDTPTPGTDSMRSRRERFLRIITLGLPILVGQLGMIVTGFADTFMVGHYSTEALASASFVNGVFNVAILTCVGFSYGLTPIVGALFSRKEYGEIGANVRAAVVVNLLVALAITLLMVLLYFNVDEMGQPEELLPVIRPYYLTVLSSIWSVSIFNAMAQWSYGIRHTRMPMWIILGANAINIVLNYLLIYGNCGFPELGLTGAGVATLLSRVLSAVAIVLVFMLRRGYAPYRAGLRHMADRRRMKLNWEKGWPVALQMACETGSFSAAAIMAGWLGKVELAAFQIILIIGTLGFCVYYSMAAAVSVLVANEAGRGDYRGMRRVALDGYIIILILAACSSTVFGVFARSMVHIFTDDPAVVAMAVGALVPLILYQFGDATQITFANALRGTARVKVMSWISFVSYVAVGLPATYLMGFTFGWGLWGLVLSFSVSLLTAAWLYVRYFRLYTTQE